MFFYLFDLLHCSSPQLLSGVPPTVRRPSRGSVVLEAEEREQQIIDHHFGFKAASHSYGEKAIDDLITACDGARRIKDFAPKGFLPALRYVNIPTLEKQIVALQTTQKKRSRTTEADYDLVVKTLIKIKADCIAGHKERKLLVACIETHGRENRKKFQECERELRQRQSEFSFLRENAPPPMSLFPIDDG